MTKSWKLVGGMGAAIGLLSLAHAKESLLVNHGTIVACSDCNAPGMPLFTTFGSSMDFATLAEDGTVFFGTNLAGPTIVQENSRAMWAGTTFAGLQMVAQWADPAPGLPGLYLVSNSGTQGTSTKRISPDGRMLWTSRLTNDARNLPAGEDTAIFGGTPGSFSVIAREGSSAPGTAGAVYGDFGALGTQETTINRNGHVAYNALLTGGDVVGSTNDAALYAGPMAAPVIVVRKGQVLLPGVVAASLSAVIQMDNNGRIVYQIRLAGAGVTTSNDDSIWLYTPGSGSTMLVREGDPAPGTTGAVYSTPSLSQNSFTRNGRYAFVSDLSGGDVVPGVNDHAIFTGLTGGSINLFLRSGQTAPGTDAVFAAFHTIFTFMNDSGRVFFQGFLTGGTTTTANDGGIWSGTTGAVTLVAREGSLAPGTNGATFRGLVTFSNMASDFGMVFIGDLVGGDVVRSTNNRGIWGWSPAKGTFLAARGGDTWEVAPGMFRTLSQAGGFVNLNNTDGAAASFSNSGMWAANVFFDNGTAVATVDLNCAPATDYYLDSDGDGHGDPATEINLCFGETPPAGYITTAGDCLDANPGALGSSPETCNLTDDDCDTLIDDGIPIPSAPLNLGVGKGTGNNVVLSWPAVSGATGYDVVTGDLTELRSVGGYQFLSQASCITNDLTATNVTINTPVNPGFGKWWIARPINCNGDGTFGSGSPKERPGRDQEIGASFYSCP